MSLEQTISQDIKKAMLAKDSKTLEALRAVKASLLLAKSGKDVAGGEVSEEAEIAILKRLVKQRKESAEIYKDKNREDMAAEELFQAGIIEKYLPAQLSAEEIEKVVQEVITQVGAESMKDMGKVMGITTKKLAGQADNKMVSEIVRKLLNS